MLKMGKTDADYNKQAIITAEETDAISHELMIMSSQGGYKISLIWLPERMNITECQQDTETAGGAATPDGIPAGKRESGTAARNHQKPYTAYRLQEDRNR